METYWIYAERGRPTRWSTGHRSHTCGVTVLRGRRPSPKTCMSVGAYVWEPIILTCMYMDATHIPGEVMTQIKYLYVFVYCTFSQEGPRANTRSMYSTD